MLSELFGENWEADLKAMGAIMEVPENGERLFVSNSKLSVVDQKGADRKPWNICSFFFVLSGGFF